MVTMSISYANLSSTYSYKIYLLRQGVRLFNDFLASLSEVNSFPILMKGLVKQLKRGSSKITKLLISIF